MQRALLPLRVGVRAVRPAAQVGSPLDFWERGAMCVFYVISFRS